LSIFSHPVWRVGTSVAATVHLLECVWCKKYTRLCTLVACCTGFDAVCGSRRSGVCLLSYAVGVLETGVKEINKNGKDCSTGKWNERNYYPIGSFFLKEWSLISMQKWVQVVVVSWHC